MSGDKMAKEQVQGLGGMLILLGLGVIFWPVYNLLTLPSMYETMFSDGTWAALTVPGGPDFNPAWAPILYTEMATQFSLWLFSLVVLYQFFAKKRMFPRAYIIFVLAALAFIVMEGGVIHLLMPDQPLFDQTMAAEFARGCIGAMIWVPYVLRSKRVRHTFVK